MCYSAVTHLTQAHVSEILSRYSRRWGVELDYRELKEELGLDHYQGRHGLGWHHHVSLVSLAFAFLPCEQARVKQTFWCDLTEGEAEPASPTD
jgi:SRSO17 transposase